MNRFPLVRSLAVPALAVLSIAATFDGDLSLKPKPKVGDAAEYSVTAHFDGDQGAIDFTQKQAIKVTGVNADGTFVRQIASSDAKATVGGQEFPIPDSSVGEVVLPNGHVKTITSDNPVDAAAYRVANIQTFQAPDNAVKQGDEIKFDVSADKTLGTPAMTGDYKVVGTEKVGTFDTVKMTYSNTEMEGDTKASSSGTVWINTADGSLVKSDGQWKNVQPPGVPAPLTGTYKVERTK